MSPSPAPRFRTLSRTRLIVMALVWAGLYSVALGQARWPFERTAGTFHWHADYALEEHELIEELAGLQRQLVESLKIDEAREPIHVIVFHKKKTYTEYLGRYFPGVPSRRALFLKVRGPGMVFAYRSDALAVDVRHESTHALLHAALPMVPLWLDEGLAEYYEVEQKQRMNGNPHLAATRWDVRLGRQKSLQSLEELTDLNSMGQAEYRRSWAWVHFMLHGPAEARDELVQFLADIQAASPPGHLSARLRARIPDLDQRFAAHFRSWKMPSGEAITMAQPAQRETPDPVESREPANPPERPRDAFSSGSRDFMRRLASWVGLSD